MGKYDASTIKVLDGLQAVQKRPSMYIGTTGKPGLHHLVYEAVDNSIDEAMAGHCTEIKISLNRDESVTVIDDGRGIPIDLHKEKKLPAVEVVMTTLHAGGKFGGEGYKVSGGLHGVGISVVNALSEWLEVAVKRDGKLYRNRYHRGIPEKREGEVTKHNNGQDTGTMIMFKPDPKVFDRTDFEYEVLMHRMRELAYLNKGLKISLHDLRGKEKVKETFQFMGGIISYVEHMGAQKTPLFSPPIYLKTEKDDIQVEVALQYNQDYYDEQVLSFANNIRTKEGGTHLSGFRTALTRSINNFAKKYELIKNKEETFEGNDVREGISAVVSIRLKSPQFEGQTKTKLGNGEVKGIVDSIVDEGLTNFLERNPSIGRQIVAKCLTALRVRQATRKAQDLARRKSSLESTTLPGKLADCSDRNPANCEIFIVEGDSAGGSAKQGRDRNYQAILPLRGKILNVEKARIDKILANEEIRALITAIGPEVISGMASENDKGEDEAFNIEKTLKKLRYHKIIIMTDADVDGAHIRTLLLTFFFRHARDIIEAGALYAAQPPLYLVKKGNSKEYAYSEEELAKIMKGKEKRGVNIQRYKGLGEMNPDQLWETTMNPQNRTLLKIEMEDAEEADEIFTVLMGSTVERRREFIEKHAKKVRWLDI